MNYAGLNVKPALGPDRYGIPVHALPLEKMQTGNFFGLSVGKSVVNETRFNVFIIQGEEC